MYEIVETSTRLYIITEFLSGGQLFERVSKLKHLSENHNPPVLSQEIPDSPFCEARKPVI
jgi:hypothetical protein